MLNPQRKPIFRNCAFKQAVRTSVRLWCHSYTVTVLSHAPNKAVVTKTKTLAELRYVETQLAGLPRLVTADQSEQTLRGGIK